MRLVVGITHLTPAWHILLEQISPPFEELNADRAWTPENYACIIVSGQPSTSIINSLQHFVSKGGALLAEAKCAGSVFEINSIGHFVDYIDTTDDPLFGAVTPGFIGRRLDIPSGATFTRDKHGKQLIELKSIGNGKAIILPEGIIDALLSSVCVRRNFPSRGRWLPSERVAGVSKRTIRELIEQCLKQLFWHRNLPFVSLSPFPDGADSVFNFRIDTDFASRQQVDKLYDLCLKHEIATTWFVETGSCEPWIDRYASMEGHEIGLHCYKHRISRKYLQNEQDVRKGKTILKKSGICPEGYAAPFGEWHPSLAKAVEHHGFSYSSEFALDYDNLPFSPLVGERFSSVVQVPVHPVSTGALRNARHSTNEMIGYFESVIEDHLARKLPLFFYDHPANPDLEALNQLFQSVRNRNISVTTMGRYADWWKRRCSTDWSARLKEERFQLSPYHDADGIHVEVARPDGTHSQHLVSGEWPLSEIEWNSYRKAPSLSPHISVLHRLNYKMVLNNILHTYWKYKL
ncbi:MAG: polysaccharide deacetylase family protein [Candidatus Neomarinimicrobiota bacterium]|nr:polysaccharide deacetylase family protein [Candidatus Neomarinimicrobiota bacterium]